VLFLLGIVPMIAFPAAAQIREQIEKPVSEAVTLRQQTQAAETRWREERQALIAEMEALELEARLLEAQKAALAQSTTATRARIDAKARELAEIERMASQIEPFLNEQLGRLEALVAIDGQPILVDIFRLGRLALFYQTLDRKQCGHYDVAAAAWRPLSTAHNRAIQAAVEIGARRKPVELLSIPLGRMVVP